MTLSKGRLTNLPVRLWVAHKIRTGLSFTAEPMLGNVEEINRYKDAAGNVGQVKKAGNK